MAEDTKFNNITQLVNELNILLEEWATVTYKLNKSKSNGLTITLELRQKHSNCDDRITDD